MHDAGSIAGPFQATQLSVESCFETMHWSGGPARPTELAVTYSSVEFMQSNGGHKGQTTEMDVKNIKSIERGHLWHSKRCFTSSKWRKGLRVEGEKKWPMSEQRSVNGGCCPPASDLAGHSVARPNLASHWENTCQRRVRWREGAEERSSSLHRYNSRRRDSWKGRVGVKKQDTTY